MFTFNHFNFNVLDLERSVRFYHDALGLEPVRTKDAADGSFRLVFLGDGHSPFQLELTGLRGRTQPYDLGEGEFHLAFSVPDMDAAIALANRVAPEHLEVLMREPWSVLPRIRHAGAVFLGPYAPEPLGDYFAGPNHVLPTNGTARFFSPLGVDDFIKKSSIISYTRDALEKAKDDIITFAEAEGLTAHANSIRVRFEQPFSRQKQD